MKHICSNCIASEICYSEARSLMTLAFIGNGDMQVYGLIIKK